jgi:hypothetical protein
MVQTLLLLVLAARLIQRCGLAETLGPQSNHGDFTQWLAAAKAASL